MEKSSVALRGGGLDYSPHCCTRLQNPRKAQRDKARLARKLKRE